jgi:hypothetical protein
MMHTSTAREMAACTADIRAVNGHGTTATRNIDPLNSRSDAYEPLFRADAEERKTAPFRSRSQRELMTPMYGPAVQGKTFLNSG